MFLGKTWRKIVAVSLVLSMVGIVVTHPGMDDVDGSKSYAYHTSVAHHTPDYYMPMVDSTLKDYCPMREVDRHEKNRV